MSWWVIIRTPAGGGTWDIGDSTPERKDELVTRAKIVMGVPADWDPQNTNWDVQLTPGRPHNRAIASAPERPLNELEAVSREALADYRTAIHHAGRQAQMDRARQLIADLDPDQRATLLAEHVRTPDRI